jgi:hypothetical protein
MKIHTLNCGAGPTESFGIYRRLSPPKRKYLAVYLTASLAYAQ